MILTMCAERDGYWNYGKAFCYISEWFRNMGPKARHCIVSLLPDGSKASNISPWLVTTRAQPSLKTKSFAMQLLLCTIKTTIYHSLNISNLFTLFLLPGTSFLPSSFYILWPNLTLSPIIFWLLDTEVFFFFSQLQWYILLLLSPLWLFYFYSHYQFLTCYISYIHMLSSLGRNITGRKYVLHMCFCIPNMLKEGFDIVYA